MAQSGHADGAAECTLLGVKRTSDCRASMCAYDPKRKSAQPQLKQGPESRATETYITSL
jgi:hypothetical protein